MRVLLCLSHAIEEYDQLRLLDSLGYEVASIGGYIDPAHPHVDLRPPLPDVPCVQEVKDAVDAIGADDNLGAAQAHIPDAVLEWLGNDGVIIYHHYLERLYGQWDRISDWMDGDSGRRVVWRTVGQSVENNELMAQPYVEDGLEIVRYSPKERNIPGYAGEDALIRFYKDPVEWDGWDGVAERVINFTQHLQQRDPYTNYRFWQQVTAPLPPRKVEPMGPGSEEIDGLGEMSYNGMRQMLRDSRCYLYCGTQPASYTLGLLEAMMTGIPVVSIGASWMNVFPYGPDLFEGHELVQLASDDPDVARVWIARMLEDLDFAAEVSRAQRAFTVSEFGLAPVAAAWREFLGAP